MPSTGSVAIGPGAVRQGARTLGTPTPPDEAHRRQAIENRTHNLLLQAGAGSGKTSTLIARMEGLLAEPGASLARIVAITFTDKAAGELKERLRDLCDRRAEAAPTAEEREVWRRHRRGIDVAHIGTIHGFCARLLRSHALRLGLDPLFEVLNDADQRLLARDTVSGFVLGGVREGVEPLRRLVAAIDVQPTVGALAASLEQRAGAALTSLCPSPEELAQRWQAETDRRLADLIGPLQTSPNLLEAAEVLDSVQPTDPADQLARLRDALLTHVRTALDADVPLQEAARAWSAIAGSGKPGNKGKAANWPSDGKAAVVEAIRELQSAAQCVLSWGPMDPGFVASAATLSAHFHTVLPQALAAYEAAKRERGAVDFDDLLILVRDLLRKHPDVCVAEGARFDHFLIDEFQDTDPVQREIIQRLAAGPGRLFLVGDVKQSIYAFRRADVTVYNATRREFDAAPDCLALSLTANFRSQPRLVAFYNELFSSPTVMGPPSEDLPDYAAPFEPLQATRPAPDAGPDVTFLVSVGPASLGDLRERAAASLADYLHDVVTRGALMVSPENEEGARRPADWRDIMVLLPTMSSVAIYERALRDAGVPYYVVSGRGFFHRPEVMDLIALLRAIEEPRDGISLARFLRSPCCGISDEGLYWLARDGGLEAGLRAVGEGAPPPRLSAEDAARAGQAADVIRGLGAARPHLGLADFVQQALDATDLPAMVAARYDGPSAYANLRKLVEMARSLEDRRPLPLARFIGHVEALRMEDIREGEAPAQEEQGDAVSLMTVHKAKGLERPVVVVADLASGGPGGRRAPVVFDSTLGPILKGEQADGSLAFPPLARVAQGEAQAREEAEGRRLLYVALTRARDHLVISTPICLKKDGAPTRTGVWLDCLLSTSGDALLTADHLTGAAGDWTAAILRDQQPAGAAPSLRALPLLRRHAGAIAGARPLGEVDEEAVQAILRRLDPCPPDLAARTRYSVTELSVYLGCPWRYRLRYVERLAPFEPSTSHPAPGRLRPVEGGLIVHRALQRLGRGIVTDLLADVRAAAHETGLAGHDPEELREVHAMLFRFLGTPTWEAVRTAAELRTEAPILARFDAGLVEGQVDALLRDRTGALHLIDYKTGRAQDAEGRPQHVFQIGVYAAALKAATGQLPATLTIHYLSTNDAVSVPASEAAAARAEAERAMQGIRAAEFPRSGDCDPSTCPYAWVCGP